jgi:uncharacterized RDD family membrane protein YckC
VSPEAIAPNHYCSECGQPRPAGELARFGDRLICPDCKSTYVQKLREGVGTVPAMAYGGFWIRFVASLIDGIIVLVADGIAQYFILGSMTTVMPGPGAAAAALSRVGASSLIGMAIGCTYEAWFVGKMAATPGKMALGLKVVRPDGSAVSYARGAARYFAKILSAIILMIGYIMAGFDAQKRALHDMICDTRVVRSR